MNNHTFIRTDTPLIYIFALLLFPTPTSKKARRLLFDNTAWKINNRLRIKKLVFNYVALAI